MLLRRPLYTCRDWFQRAASFGAVLLFLGRSVWELDLMRAGDERRRWSLRRLNKRAAAGQKTSAVIAVILGGESSVASLPPRRSAEAGRGSRRYSAGEQLDWTGLALASEAEQLIIRWHTVCRSRLPVPPTLRLIVDVGVPGRATTTVDGGWPTDGRTDGRSRACYSWLSRAARSGPEPPCLLRVTSALSSRRFINHVIPPPSLIT